MSNKTVGYIVLIESDKKHAYWTLANVQKLNSGKDGHPRKLHNKN